MKPKNVQALPWRRNRVTPISQKQEMVSSTRSHCFNWYKAVCFSLVNNALWKIFCSLQSWEKTDSGIKEVVFESWPFCHLLLILNRTHPIYKHELPIQPKGEKHRTHHLSVISTSWGFPGGSVVKNPPAMQKMQVHPLGPEDPLEKQMATHSSILAGEFLVKRSLAGYGPWGHKESDTTEWLNSNSKVLVEYMLHPSVLRKQNSFLKPELVWRPMLNAYY